VSRPEADQNFGDQDFFADTDHDFRIRCTLPVVKTSHDERNEDTDGTIRNVIHSADAAQAQSLLGELWRHVEDVSVRLEKAERRMRRSSACDRREVSKLRADLYQTHHLIDALHRRFPETCPHQLPTGTAPDGA